MQHVGAQALDDQNRSAADPIGRETCVSRQKRPCSVTFQGSLRSVTAAPAPLQVQGPGRAQGVDSPSLLRPLVPWEVPDQARQAWRECVCGIALAPTSGVVESPARTVMQAGKCRVQREPTRARAAEWRAKLLHKDRCACSHHTLRWLGGPLHRPAHRDS